MRGLFQHLARSTLEHELSRIHDGHTVAHPRNRPQVVADVDHRGSGLRCQVAQQLEDMGLSGDIETGRRLVEQQNVRLAGQRHGNGNPLLLTAGELVGITFRQFLRFRQAHLRQQLDSAFPSLLPGEPGVELHGLVDLLADP